MNDGLIVEETGNDGTVAEEEPDQLLGDDNSEKADDFGEATIPPPPSTLIYVCSGTAKPMAYCQFPFSTLAGNHYTSTCADKVEDNPDYSVDRPWCFTSASEWGFCDCDAFFDFSYVTDHNFSDKTLRDIKVQIKLDYPGSVWCALSPDSKSLPSLSGVTSGAVTGAATSVTHDMIARDISGQLQFSATPDFMKAHVFLSCQADVPGLINKPQPVVTQLGTEKDMLDEPDDDEDTAPPKPRLVTKTSGALMYSTLIFMILTAILFYRYAMDRRMQMLSFIRLDQDESVVHPLTQIQK
jgi:hypothetical protein